MRWLLESFDQQEARESLVSVIVGALAIVALFDPVKHRIRRFVDRRIFGEGNSGSRDNRNAIRNEAPPRGFGWLSQSRLPIYRIS